jgi:hypothetical protein
VKPRPLCVSPLSFHGRRSHHSGTAAPCPRGILRCGLAPSRSQPLLALCGRPPAMAQPAWPPPRRASQLRSHGQGPYAPALASPPRSARLPSPSEPPPRSRGRAARVAFRTRHQPCRARQIARAQRLAVPSQPRRATSARTHVRLRAVCRWDFVQARPRSSTARLPPVYPSSTPPPVCIRVARHRPCIAH